MKKSIIIFLAILSMVISACHINNTDKFIEKEQNNIKGEIESILSELGYTDYTIHLYFHKNNSNRELSKSISTVRIFGDKIPANAMDYAYERYKNHAEETDNQDYIINGYLESRKMIVNYDEIITDKIYYEYLSIVIIIAGIDQKETNELLKLFSNFILNNNRGDTIFIKQK